jgi:hypothetical protein
MQWHVPSQLCRYRMMPRTDTLLPNLQIAAPAFIAKMRGSLPKKRNCAARVLSWGALTS